MDLKKIGKFIAKKRQEKNLTQECLAEKLDISNRSISKWERGICLPDIDNMTKLCQIFDITYNDLLNGNEIPKEQQQEKSEKNIVDTLRFADKKIRKSDNILGITLIAFGVITSMSALTIFKSESSWGAIFSIFGSIIFLIGISRFTKKLIYWKRVVLNFSCYLLFLGMLFLIDYLSVINLHQAPRFSHRESYGEASIYYDTPFYGVIRCNPNQENETWKIVSPAKIILKKKPRNTA